MSVWDFPFAERRGQLGHLAWPAPAAVACAAAERLVVQAAEFCPETLLTPAQQLLEAAWEHVAASSTDEAEAAERTRAADGLIQRLNAGEVDVRCFSVVDAALVSLAYVWSAVGSRELRDCTLAIAHGDEWAVELASRMLQHRFGSGERYETADIYRAAEYVREVAAVDADLDVAERQGVSASGVAELRRAAVQVGSQQREALRVILSCEPCMRHGHHRPV